MTMFGNGLFIVLLAVLVPSLGSQPGPDELPDKLAGLLAQLIEAKADFQCIFDVTNEQCPCQTPGDCFESDLEALKTTLCDLINNLTALIGDQSTDCPALEGCAALVGGCDRTDIAQVDPVGTILPSINTDKSVSGLTVRGDTETNYYIYWINCWPPTVVELCLPLRTETVILGPDDNSGKYTGIASWDDKLYVAIDDYNGTDDDVLVCLCKSGGAQVEVIVNISCEAGTVRVFNCLIRACQVNVGGSPEVMQVSDVYRFDENHEHGVIIGAIGIRTNNNEFLVCPRDIRRSKRVYFSDCKEIQCVNETGGDLQTKLKFSMAIKSFDVIDEDRIVFIDAAGGVWIYDISTKCFKLLKCISGDACGDVKINRCSSLIYLAYPGVSELDIFSTTTCERVKTLPYTTTEPTPCPSLGFKPACPTDDGGDEKGE